MTFLRQSTASQEIMIGPFVAYDGTPLTGLTIANTDINLRKAGATTEGSKNSGGATHIAGGRYSAVLDATDTDTVGDLDVSCNPSGGIPWTRAYQNVEEAVYDQLFAASAPGAATPTALAALVTTVGVAGAGLTAADDAVITALSTLQTTADAIPTNAELATALTDLDVNVVSVTGVVLQQSGSGTQEIGGP